MNKNIKGFIWVLVNKNNARYLNKIRKELNRIWKESNNFIENHIPNNDDGTATTVNRKNQSYLESLHKLNNPFLNLQLAPNLSLIHFYENHSGDVKTFFRMPVQGEKSYFDLIKFDNLDYSFIVRFKEEELK